MITDHAIVRYLERTGKIDRAKIEAEILCPAVQLALAAGATSVRANGVTFCLRNGYVTTVLDNDKPLDRRRSKYFTGSYRAQRKV